MLAAVEACTGVRAEAVVGKPSRHMARRPSTGSPCPRTSACWWVIGSATDIAMAAAAGMASALVLSGDSQADDLAGSDLRPTYLLDTIAGLLEERD